MSKLTPEAVLERAVALADHEGVEAITIRRLAGDLDVTPMALYWHFKNKDELLTAAADHLLATVTPHDDPGSPWLPRLRAMVETLIGVMRRHPCLPTLIHQADKNQVESFTRATDRALALLEEAGFPLTEGFYVSSYLLNGCTSLVNGQPDRRPGMSPEEAAEFRRRHRLSLQALPADRYPRIVRYAAETADPPDVERYYSLGLDLLMAGVEAMAAKNVPAGATPKSTA